MGLDMYLNAKRYLWFNENETKDKIEEIVPCPFANEGVKEISYGVLYWRKANAIHNWFVENVQNGNDDCGDYYVGVEHLIELRDICKNIVETAVLKVGEIYCGTRFSDGVMENIYEDGYTIVNAEEIAELLPATSGFFFGSTDYDSYYLDSVKSTLESLNKILSIDEKELERWEFSYHSSW